MAVDFADFNRDGRVDLVWTRCGSDKADFFLNKNLNPAGWPFQPDKPVPLHAGRLPCFMKRLCNELAIGPKAFGPWTGTATA